MLDVFPMIEELDVRLKPDEDEQAGHLQRPGLTRGNVFQRDLLDLAVLTLDLGDDRVGDQLDLGMLKRRLDQNGLGPELLAPVDDVDLLREAGQEHALLEGGIAATDHGHLLFPEEGAITDRALRNAATLELALAGDAKLERLPPRRPGPAVGGPTPPRWAPP